MLLTIICQCIAVINKLKPSKSNMELICIVGQFYRTENIFNISSFYHSLTYLFDNCREIQL